MLCINAYLLRISEARILQIWVGLGTTYFMWILKRIKTSLLLSSSNIKHILHEISMEALQTTILCHTNVSSDEINVVSRVVVVLQPREAFIACQ